MAGARSVLAKVAPAKGAPHKVFKRQGSPTKVEKEFVAQLVQDQPGEMKPAQVNALAKALRRGRAVVKEMVENARENFVAGAERYVEIHAEAVEAALAGGDNEVAMKGAQWAMTNIASEGSRIIDKASTEPTGTKILIGVSIGGVQSPHGPVTLPALPAVTSEPIKSHG